MKTQANGSVIGRLLEEISWEGSRVRAYRDGGRGLENVLTAEVLLPLSYLPRSMFLGEVLRATHGAKAVCAQLAAEIEQAEVTLLPEQLLLGKHGMVVQPDATIVTPTCHVLVEAKRIRRSSFQPEQLAREYLGLLQSAGSKTALLLLILGSPPPVVVKGHGPLQLMDAITMHLEKVNAESGSHIPLGEVAARIPEVVGWTTWDDIRDVVARQLPKFTSLDPGVAGTVLRLCNSVTTAIEWHS